MSRVWPAVADEDDDLGARSSPGAVGGRRRDGIDERCRKQRRLSRDRHGGGAARGERSRDAVTTPPQTPLQTPCDELHETKVIPVGSGSETVTPSAVDGPGSDDGREGDDSSRATGFGKADFRTERFTEPPAGVGVNVIVGVGVLVGVAVAVGVTVGVFVGVGVTVSV